MTELTDRRFETLALHAGQAPPPDPGAVSTPIYQTATYRLADPGSHGEQGEYYYSRFGNPTVVALERVAAALEGGDQALAFSCGMAAATAAMSLLGPGDHLVSTADLYGGTARLLRDHVGRYEIAFDLVDGSSPGAVEAVMRPNTRMIWVDTLSTPLLAVSDINLMARVAHQHGALLGVDNTISTPYFQNPLSQGADLVMHSCTKYLGGHNDLFAGLLVMNESLYRPLLDTRTMTGGILGPFDAWLVLRGIKTLAVRLEAVQRSAMAVARFLEGQPRIGRVLYPGLESHPQHDLARRQMRGFGGIVTLGLEGPQTAAEGFVGRLQVFTSAVSFGGAESLCELPPNPTARQRDQAGLAEGLALVRLSIGLEHPDDLIADLEQALASPPLRY
jgi:cystathionine beta-lyase/cystathionine gamma-synthase